MDASDLLAEAEIRAERAISCVRLVVSVLLGIAVLFILSQPGNAEGKFGQVMPFILVFLIGYFTIGVGSLLLARPGRFRDWMPWAFSTADLFFWSILLVANVINLGLPWNSMLISPPIWLAPLVLALAVLRYNPWLQAYTTLFVFGALFAVAGFAPSGESSPVTTTPELGFLISPPMTIARTAMLLLASLALFVAAVRARELLNRGIDEAVRRTNLTRFLPRQVADQLAESGEDVVQSGREQHAAVMFVDIRDFTARAEDMEPQALGTFLTEFRRVVARAVEEHGGVVDKFVGDSAMVVFGIPEPGSRDPVNALNAARALLDAVQAWNAERETADDDAIRIGVGLHWGQVFCGAVGDDTRLEFTVLGDTVNVAARLEEATKRADLSLVVSEELLTAAGVDPDTEDGWIALPDTSIRGRHGNVRHYGCPGRRR